MAADKDLQALDLRRAGVALPKIVEQLKFRSRASCEAAIRRAMKAQGVETNPVQVRLAELDRLDQLQAQVWVKARRGDLNAVDRVLKLTEMRMRLAGVVESGISTLAESFDATVDALKFTDDELVVFGALISQGRRYCEQVDAMSGLGDPTAVTKAMHTIPHVTNILRELGATPAARGAIREAADASGSAGSQGARVSALDAWREKQAGS